MAVVQAGAMPGNRIVGYSLLGLGVVVLATVPTVLLFGPRRVVTGIAIGLVLAIAVLIPLVTRDAVVLTENALYQRRPWSVRHIGWDRVVAGRFTLDEHARWVLALDLTEGDEPHGELVLLSIPPVQGPVTGAYDMRKREQVNEIRAMLRHKRVPVTVLPEIAAALEEHWRIAPPTR